MTPPKRIKGPQWARGVAIGIEELVREREARYEAWVTARNAAKQAAQAEALAMEEWKAAVDAVPATGAPPIELKCWPGYFDGLINGNKTFEVRRDDRPFKVGSLLHIREWTRWDEPAYTGREAFFRVTYLVRGPTEWGFPAGWVVMGLEAAERP